MREAERRYYQQRASEYDDWYLGRGLFRDYERPGWDEELDALVALLEGLPPRRVLDVGCGTGFLTRRLRGDVTGVDQSEEMLEIARGRCPDATFLRADGLALPFENESFDLVFTAHFYGHLRASERRRFLLEARRVARELFVVDTALRPDVEAEELQERVLGEGSRHTVYKRYFTPEGLAEEIGDARPLFGGAWFVAAAG